MPTITFDGPNKIIDIGYDSPTTVVTVVDIYSRWKDWVVAGNAQYDEAFSTSVGGNPLGGGVTLDAYLFLRNDLGWRIRAADIDHTLVIDGQLFGEAAGTAIYLTRPLRTINVRETLSSRSQIINPAADAVSAAGAFQGVVYVSSTSVHSGTQFPNGTSVQPVNMVADAVAIALTYGLRNIQIEGDITIFTNIAGFTIWGLNYPTITLDATANATDASFQDCHLIGQIDGFVHINNSEIGPLTGVHGYVTDCHIVDEITLAGETNFMRVNDAIAVGSASINLNGLPLDVTIRNYTGGLILKNVVAGAEVAVDLMPGRLTLAASCTGGTVRVKGLGEPTTDLSGGAVTMLDDGFSAHTAFIEAATGFQGTVWIDPLAPNSDTTYPTGTSVQPVNNWIAAVQIANTYGIRRINLLGSLPLIGADVSGFHVVAENPSTVLFIDSSATVVDTTFESMAVTGTADGYATFFRCGIAGLTAAHGNFVDSVIAQGGLTINGDTYMSNCASGVPGDTHCELYFAAGGSYQVQIRGFKGAFGVHTMGAGSFLSVDFDSGHLTVSADNLGGTVAVRGVGEPITDSSGGLVTINSTGYVTKASIVNPLVANIWAAS